MRLGIYLCYQPYLSFKHNICHLIFIKKKLPVILYKSKKVCPFSYSKCTGQDFMDMQHVVRVPEHFYQPYL